MCLFPVQEFLHVLSPQQCAVAPLLLPQCCNLRLLLPCCRYLQLPLPCWGPATCACWAPNHPCHPRLALQLCPLDAPLQGDLKGQRSMA